MLKIFKFIIKLILLLVLVIVGINLFVKFGGERYLQTPDQVSSEPRDCIIVLGAGVYGNGKPTKILQDRLDRGIELYKAGAAPKLLLSGDNGKANYDEVKVMRNYCLEHGVSAEDIFLDLRIDVSCACCIWCEFGRNRHPTLPRGAFIIHGQKTWYRSGWSQRS